MMIADYELALVFHTVRQLVLYNTYYKLDCDRHRDVFYLILRYNNYEDKKFLRNWLQTAGLSIQQLTIFDDIFDDVCTLCLFPTS